MRCYGQNRAKSNEIPHRRNGRSAEMRAKRSPGSGRLGGSAAKDHLRHCRGPRPQLYPTFGTVKNGNKGLQLLTWPGMDPNRVMPTLTPQNQPGAYNLPCVTSSAPAIRQQIWKALLINHFPSENPAKMGRFSGLWNNGDLLVRPRQGSGSR